ncbi:MAG TPA: hypothetical protein VIF62_07455 [Labilithrix sp.]
MDVSVLLEPKIDLERLAEVLDGLGHEGRVHATRTWHKKRQSAIFEACKGRTLDLDFLVPPSIGELVEVIHDGKNTLPMFTHFQKRFVRLPAGEEHKVGGYNEQSLSVFSGPGFFVCKNGDGEHEGEIAIDYTHVPKHKPDSWPGIRDNEGGLAGVVYGGMVDYLRRVSNNVSIGHAWKNGKPIDAWFTLVRKDVS